MDSKQTFSGEELKQLYKDGQFTDDLQTHENLKKLLNYELDVMGDTIDSNFNFEIIDFCIAKIKEMESMDEQKLNYLGDKISSEAKETERKENTQRSIKTAAKLTVVGVVACALIFTGQEGLAGKFDFVHSIFSKDKGEQVALTTNQILSEIAFEDSHLPTKLPKSFTFLTSDQNSSSAVSTYNYTFVDSNKNKLNISIKDFDSYKIALNNELEINRDSLRKEKKDGITYYYSSNKAINSISWVYKDCIFKVTGEFSFEKLEEIVSYYEEKQ